MLERVGFHRGRASEGSKSGQHPDTGIVGTGERGLDPIHLSKASTGITDAPVPGRNVPELQVRLKPPTLRVWSTAFLSTSVCAFGFWFFRSTPAALFAIPAFLCVEVVFACLGLYWIIRAWLRGWGFILLGGLATLVPAVFILQGEASMIAWVGHREVVIPVRVVDDKDGSVIPGAVVRLYAHKEDDKTEGSTNASGEVRVAHGCQTYGTTSLLVHTALFELGLLHIEVDAPGYWSVESYLDEYSPGTWEVHGAPVPQIEVRLVRKQ
jgi:hypothetical protein